MSFNDESVVRAAARSAIPLIAAIGHETDWTLIDHAADLRAPTPTAAAEFATPVRAELIASLADLDGRARGAILRFAQRLRGDLRAVARALPGGEAIVAGPRQRLDRAAESFADPRPRRARPARAPGGRARATACAPFAARVSRGPARAPEGAYRAPARLGPVLIERLRRAADAAGRALRARVRAARDGAGPSARRRCSGSRRA